MEWIVNQPYYVYILVTITSKIKIIIMYNVYIII